MILRLFFMNPEKGIFVTVFVREGVSDKGLCLRKHNFLYNKLTSMLIVWETKLWDFIKTLRTAGW